MPFIQATRGLYYRVGTGPLVQIRDSFALDYRIVRAVRYGGTAANQPPMAQHLTIYGWMFFRDPDTADGLIDLVEYWGYSNVDLLCRYQLSGQNRTKCFRNVIFGCVGGMSFQTPHELTGDGNTPIQQCPFIAGTPAGACKVRDWVLNSNE